MPDNLKNSCLVVYPMGNAQVNYKTMPVDRMGNF
jgi:hypothetical protein